MSNKRFRLWFASRSQSNLVRYNFGSSVSIDNNIIVVGANGHQSNGGTPGAAYVFTRWGTTWTGQETLLASDGERGDFFGVSVAIDGNTTVVGAFGSHPSGSAYIFSIPDKAIPGSPGLSVSTNGLNASLVWNAINGASGYKLYYAPYPYNSEIDSINSVDLGNKTTYSANLWQGAAFYSFSDK